MYTRIIVLECSCSRMDADQSARRIAQDTFNIKDPDYYEFEGHIFFDDAMDLNENDKWVPNQFVKTLVSVINEAARFVVISVQTSKSFKQRDRGNELRGV